MSSILNNDDFVINSNAGTYSSLDVDLNNIIKNNNQPAIVGGGKNILNKNKYGIPFGLAVLKDFDKQLSGGNFLDDDNEQTGGVISEDLYSKLLGISSDVKKKKAGAKPKKKTRNNRKRDKKNRKTRRK
jgi:hypothetical protein